MRHLLAFLLMLPVFAWGQTSLPRCTAAETDWGARRHNCFGAITALDGEKYLGDWQDGTWHGQGTQYHAAGNIALSGRWENGKLVQRFALDTNRFPFNSPVAHVGKAERDRLTAEAELKRQKEIDRRLAAAAHEWERANRFRFNAPVTDPGKAERDRLPTLARNQSSFSPC